MILHDKHLQQALRNAPDQELVPDDATRHAVLTYASEAIKTRHRTWFSRLIDMFNFSSWQLATVGSVFATLLVVVVFWHELPDEAMWGVSEPTVFNEGAVDAVSSEQFSDKKIAEATLEEKYLAKKLPDNLSQRKEAEKNIQVLRTPSKKADNSVVASADVGRSSDKMPSVLPSVLDADKFSVATVPATIAETNTNSVISSGKIEGSVEDRHVDLGAREQVQMSIKSNAAVKAHADTKNKAMAPVGAAKSAEIPEYDGNSALAIAISAEGGKVMANKDINRGVLRQVHLEAYLSDSPPECEQKKTHATTAVDDMTGYPVEVISACYVTDLLVKEVAIYNQTMREWHGRGASQ